MPACLKPLSFHNLALQNAKPGPGKCNTIVMLAKSAIFKICTIIPPNYTDTKHGTFFCFHHFTAVENGMSSINKADKTRARLKPGDLMSHEYILVVFE